MVKLAKSQTTWPRLAKEKLIKRVTKYAELKAILTAKIDINLQKNKEKDMSKGLCVFLEGSPSTRTIRAMEKIDTRVTKYTELKVIQILVRSQ